MSQCKHLQLAYKSLLRNLPNKPRSVGRDRWPPCTKFPFLELLVSHSDPCPPKRQSLSVHHIHSNLKALRHDLWQELLNISPGTIQFSVQNRYKSHIQSGVWVQGKHTPLLPLQTPGPEKRGCTSLSPSFQNLKLTMRICWLGSRDSSHRDGEIFTMYYQMRRILSQLCWVPWTSERTDKGGRKSLWQP